MIAWERRQPARREVRRIALQTLGVLQDEDVEALRVVAAALIWCVSGQKEDEDRAFRAGVRCVRRIDDATRAGDMAAADRAQLGQSVGRSVIDWHHVDALDTWARTWARVERRR